MEIVPLSPVTSARPVIEVVAVPVESPSADPIVAGAQAEDQGHQGEREAERGAPGSTEAAAHKPDTWQTTGSASALSAPQQGAAPMRTPRRVVGWRLSKKLLAAAAVLAVLIVAGTTGVAMLFASSPHHTAPSSPSRHQRRPHNSPGTAARVVSLTPGRLWYFPPVLASADQTILTISNRNNAIARVRIRALDKGVMQPRRLQIPASGEIEAFLPLSSLQSALRVRANIPVLPLRLVFRQGRTSFWPGVRLSNK